MNVYFAYNFRLSFVLFFVFVFYFFAFLFLVFFSQYLLFCFYKINVKAVTNLYCI